MFAQTINLVYLQQNHKINHSKNAQIYNLSLDFLSFFFICANSPLGESSHTFLKNKQRNYFYLRKKKLKYPWKWFVTRMMFTIYQKRFSFLKKTFISFFYKWSEPSQGEPSRSKNGFGANRPGRNWFWSEPSRNRLAPSLINGFAEFIQFSIQKIITKNQLTIKGCDTKYDGTDTNLRNYYIINCSYHNSQWMVS